MHCPYTICYIILQVQRIHDIVNVGDYLVLNRATVKFVDMKLLKKKIVYPFHDLLINAEIKVDKYAVRHVSHIPCNTQQNWRPRFPERLETKLWAPSELFEARKSNTRKSENHNPFFDIIGVILYVGRIERREMFRDDVKLADNTIDEGSQGLITISTVVKNHRIFCAYRWIKIVDKTSQPLA